MAICINCGKQVADGVAFCTNCGTAMTADAAKQVSQPEAVASSAPTAMPMTLQPVSAVQIEKASRKEKQKPSKEENPRRGRKSFLKFFPWLVSFVLLVALLGVIFIPRWLPSGGIKTYRTPEKAIERTFERLISCDIEGALASMWGANEEATSLVRHDIQLEQGKSFLPINGLLPGEYDLYERINAEQLRADAVRCIRLFYLSTTEAALSGEMDLTDIVRLEDGGDEASMESFSRRLNPLAARDLQILDIQLAVPETQMTQVVQDAFAHQNAVFGFLESRQYVVLLSLYGRQYACGVTTVRTERGWQIYNFTSYLAGFNTYGGIVEVSQSEYEEMTK